MEKTISLTSIEYKQLAICIEAYYDIIKEQIIYYAKTTNFSKEDLEALEKLYFKIFQISIDSEID